MKEFQARDALMRLPWFVFTPTVISDFHDAGGWARRPLFSWWPEGDSMALSGAQRRSRVFACVRATHGAHDRREVWTRRAAALSARLRLGLMPGRVPLRPAPGLATLNREVAQA